MQDHARKGAAFRALHHRNRAFVIPNPWDRGSAHLLERAGFEALATTSAGYAFSRGLRDNRVGREGMLAHIRDIAQSTVLPVSADLENGFGGDPETVAQTLRLAAEAGAVGGSIEDATGDAQHPVYDFNLAVERVQAAVEAVRGLSFPFTLTARAENFIAGNPDLEDTLDRLCAYERAGADVLYAPGLSRREDIASVLAAIGRPLNVLAGVKGMTLDLAAMSRLGVARISIGSALARTAYGAAITAISEMRDRGGFAFASDAPSHATLNQMFD